ncbi:MAG: PHP domain-containing protein [Candidatus Methylomirabilales bacterium]
MHTSPSRGADLHLHSTYSDGSFSPREVVAQAAACHVNPISLTDHDTVAGMPEALQASAELQVEVIPGVELSVYESNRETHILGYFIHWEDAAFQKTILPLQAERHERLEEILRRLHRLGIPLALADVLRIAGKGTVGRLHVARALVTHGVVSTLQDAFDHFLARGRPAYVERVGLTADQAITTIRNAAGIAVLAHPGQNGLAHLSDLIEAGLQGIEVFHPSHSAEDVVTLTRVATEHGLLITGGSDCHGLAKGEVCLGQVRLPSEFMERLRQATPAPGTPWP